MAAFEMLKDSLVERPKTFFCTGFSDDEFTVNLEYTKKVRSLHKHPYTASVLWWHSQGAISESDMEELRLIREHRDAIAHNMPKMIATSENNINLDLLTASNTILAKIDNWWLQNIEAAIDPEQYEKFDQEEMDAALSMNALFLSMMIPLVAGDDSQFRALYAMWCNQNHESN